MNKKTFLLTSKCHNMITLRQTFILTLFTSRMVNPIIPLPVIPIEKQTFLFNIKFLNFSLQDSLLLSIHIDLKGSITAYFHDASSFFLPSKLRNISFTCSLVRALSTLILWNTWLTSCGHWSFQWPPTKQNKFCLWCHACLSYTHVNWLFSFFLIKNWLVSRDRI